jgi:hypothetical protein
MLEKNYSWFMLIALPIKQMILQYLASLFIYITISIENKIHVTPDNFHVSYHCISIKYI